MSSINVAGTIKLIAQIAGVAHELGDYAAPIVKGIAEMRAKAPMAPDGQELTPADVQARIAGALATATGIEQKADAELDRGTKLDA